MKGLTCFILSAFAIAATGCESRHLTHTWADGSTSEYRRTTIGRSNTEGVTLKYGEMEATLEASGSREGELVSAAVRAAIEAGSEGVGP